MMHIRIWNVDLVSLIQSRVERIALLAYLRFEKAQRRSEAISFFFCFNSWLSLKPFFTFKWWEFSQLASRQLLRLFFFRITSLENFLCQEHQLLWLGQLVKSKWWSCVTTFFLVLLRCLFTWTHYLRRLTHCVMISLRCELVLFVENGFLSSCAHAN